jgi:hypothetical protein
MGDRAYVLQTTEGLTLGFLLLASDGPEGDCVVMTLPVAPLDRADSEAVFAVCHRVAGELRFRRTEDGLVVDAPLTFHLRARPDGGFDGMIGDAPIHAVRAEPRR